MAWEWGAYVRTSEMQSQHSYLHCCSDVVQVQHKGIMTVYGVELIECCSSIACGMHEMGLISAQTILLRSCIN